MRMTLSCCQGPASENAKFNGSQVQNRCILLEVPTAVKASMLAETLESTHNPTRRSNPEEQYMTSLIYGISFALLKNSSRVR